jgi:dTDP-4-dehydrorhamnose reductase
MKILLLGGGFLGQAILREFSQLHDLVCASKTPRPGRAIPLDLFKTGALESLCEKFKPQVIINTISQPSYYKCQIDELGSLRLNVSSNAIATKIAKKVNAKYVFISSSYIFDGKKGNYSESSLDYSDLAYATQKLTAEKDVKKLRDYLIIRLETLFGADPETGIMRVGSKTLKGKFNILNEKLERSPIQTHDAAVIIRNLIEKGAQGVYNVAGRRRFSLDQFLLLLSRGDKTVEFNIQSSKDWLLRPPRDTTLNLSKICALGIDPPNYFSEL